MSLDLGSYLLGKSKGGGGQPNLQSKSITITENGTSNVTPDTGYDGLSQVNVTTNVPGASTIQINDCTRLFFGNIRRYEYATLLPICKPTTCERMFQDSSLFYNANFANLAYLDTRNCTKFNQMFYNCYGLTTVDFSGFTNFDTSRALDIQSMFLNCSGLTSINISNFVTSSCNYFGQMFSGCTSLQHLDMRNMTFENYSNGNNMFNNVPAGCEIIVKSQTEKDFILANIRSDLTNIKTVAEL